MYYFEIKDIKRLVPHQNNIIHVKTHSFKTTKLENYQEMIQVQIMEQVVKNGYKKITREFIKIVYYFVYKVTDKKGITSYHDLYTTQRGDYVNIAKSVDDALEGVLYANDKQIIDSRSVLIPGREYKIIIGIEAVNPTHGQDLLRKVKIPLEK